VRVFAICNCVMYCSLSVFIDYDFLTGFGTPFEMLLEGTYLIRSKGGIVGGFSGFMSFIPELELS